MDNLFRLPSPTSASHWNEMLMATMSLRMFQKAIAKNEAEFGHEVLESILRNRTATLAEA
jgi:hypothetical protein